jgi:hypothetical protein
LVKGGVTKYCVIDIKYGMYILLEDMELAEILISKMIKLGVKIYDSIEDLPLPKEKIQPHTLEDFLNLKKTE